MLSMKTIFELLLSSRAVSGAFQKRAFLSHCLPLAGLTRTVRTGKERKATPTPRGLSLA